MKFPFKQIHRGGKIIREFSRDVDSEELVWHRDHSDRIVKVISGSGWMLQMENQLPKPLSSGQTYHIPAKQYHRVIRGETGLVIEIREISFES